ncbi:hypothetical protein HBI46_188230 [Parastagonospora nodorum]|nr:hypothetical protein HBI46_188230 [Parastagonospora nodorum]KAH6455709.1 hypothetical protein HBI57_129740 [Parastagonospora nodorum]KAH6470655.1 hypothetical protein HBI58_159460 [Parastagonospora nodorum]
MTSILRSSAQVREIPTENIFKNCSHQIRCHCTSSCRMESCFQGNIRVCLPFGSAIRTAAISLRTKNGFALPRSSIRRNACENTILIRAFFNSWTPNVCYVGLQNSRALTSTVSLLVPTIETFGPK